MSVIEKLESRLAALEAEVAKIKETRTPEEGKASSPNWVDKIYGSFANDPDYVEAMRLGRQYRESTKPKSVKRKKPKKRKASGVDS